MDISFFKVAKDTSPEHNFDFHTFLGYVKDGKWEDLVHDYRTGKIQKITLPAVTISGTFSKRNADSLIQHSNIISIDIDYKDNEDADIEALKHDPYTWAVHQSVGGRGYVAYFKIDPAKHLQSYYGLEKYLADFYKVIADKSCKDVCRLRFISWDPHLFKKPTEPKVFKIYLKDVEKEVKKTSIIASNHDYQYIIDQIQEKHIDLTNSSYHEWLQIGFALSNGLGEQGRDIFHAVSSQSAKYDELLTDAKYNNLLKNKKDGITLNSFFYLCGKAGINTQTVRTKTIIAHTQIAKGRENQTEAQAKDSAIKMLAKDGIEGEDVEYTVNAAWQSETKTKGAQKESQEIDGMITMLKAYDIKYNIVKERNEINGNEFTDKDFNSIYIEIRKQIGKSVQPGLLNSIIDSHATPSYNPFLDYLEKNTYTGQTGYIDQVCNTLKGSNINFESHMIQHFVTKWMLGVIASMTGTHSVMILVLLGGQGIGKTNFLRGLLPESLHEYFCEEQIDPQNKDHVSVMCENLILCNDEFGGMTKKEEKFLKNITSKKSFQVRKPYERRLKHQHRYGVFCGTSNDNQILNDLTGNRRIIPIELQTIDFETFNEINKDALFAELYNLYKSIGKGWQLDTRDIDVLNTLTISNKLPSVEEESIVKCFYPADSEGNKDKMTATQILDFVGEYSNLRLSMPKLGIALKGLGFVQKTMKYGKSTQRIYEVIKRTM